MRQQNIRKLKMIILALGAVATIWVVVSMITGTIEQINARGNTTANFSNFGIAAEEGGWIYTIDPRTGAPALYKINIEDGKAAKLYEGECSSINLSCGWVYFIAGGTKNPGGSLLKMQTSGGDATILKTNVDKALLVGYWIYCQNGSASGISRIRTDGTEDTQLLEGQYTLLDVQGEWIYYLQYDSGYTTQSLYKMQLDGSLKQHIMDGLYQPIIDGEWIYQCRRKPGLREEFNPVEKIRIDSTERVLLTEQGCSKLMLDGQWLYYTTADSIYRMKTDGSENTKIASEPYEFMNITQDWLIYRSGKDTSDLLGGAYDLKKMHKDGSGLSLLWSFKNIVEAFDDTLMTQAYAPGNSNNDNLVTRQGDWVFFSGVHKRLYRMRSDGTQLKAILSEGCTDLSIVGNRLYYLSDDPGMYHRSSDLSMASYDTVTPDYLIYPVNTGTAIYYCNTYGDGYIYSMNLQGQNKTKIGTDRQVWYLNLAGDWLYYCTTDGKTSGAVVKIKTDGSERTVIAEGRFSNLTPDGDWLYYCDEAQDKTLYKMRTDGSQKTSLGVMADCFNLNDNWIFYTDNRIKMLYRMNKDGSNAMMISDYQTKQILLVGDWVYCYGFEDGKMIRMRFDGSEVQKIIK